MPIRLTCPSCSATLSIKDEHAGRAVKCPKCGNVIPAASPTPPYDPQVAKPRPRIDTPPESAPPDELDEPPTPAKPRTAGRTPGRADNPPRRKEPRPKRADEPDDDRPAPPRGPGTSGALIVALLLIPIFTCCGGLGFAGWWAYTKFMKIKEDVVEAFDKWQPRVNANTFAELDVGETTRAEAEAKLGPGRTAAEADLMKAFAHGGTDGREAWAVRAATGRVVIWQNGDDYLIAAFHPTADGTGRLQAKQWRPRSGAALKDGELDDAAFEKEYPPGGGPGLPVSAAELTRAFREDRPAAELKYKRKWLLVEGKVGDVDWSGADLVIELDGAAVAGERLRVRVALLATAADQGLKLSVGQTVRLRGKCNGTELEKGTVTSTDPDPNPTVTAADLVANFDFFKRAEPPGRTYANKLVTVTGAVFERREGDTLYLKTAKVAGSLGKKPFQADNETFAVKLKGDSGFLKAAEALKPGATVTVKGFVEPKPPSKSPGGWFGLKDARIVP